MKPLTEDETKVIEETLKTFEGLTPKELREKLDGLPQEQGWLAALTMLMAKLTFEIDELGQEVEKHDQALQKITQVLEKMNK